MKVQEYANDNSLWIEITGQKGFLMFGDLAEEQGKSGKVDILCSNCPHKLPFEIVKKEDNGNVEKVWNWKHWRVFLKGNQVRQGSRGYWGKFKVAFYCAHCMGWLRPRPKL